ncbi:low specificity L-threonine aldolase [Halococcus sp. IIIV-5B]|uniref:threonine aldolase family protein n=1 Tax=Halococcus sp. IIIV-5B TaxID=2321230 RepID=UPI000E7654A1|nr:low specificity L-threonine aldolase [Halococcus sp. IIIV-5B]RJT00767.1 low specificity L-threonine aldolase [Halococcus sp. IIIV-5B]
MIDLRSDTVTRPSDAMREAARTAEVGDDVYGEDPTVNDLEARAAEAVGMEAALYVPTGTMGNQIAARTHTDRGEEVLCERESHIYKWELAGLAQHSALQARTIDGGPRGTITPEDIDANYVPADGHRAGTGLLALENTHNSKGGVAIPAEAIDAAAEAAHDLDIPVHVDGARVFNASVALDTPAPRLLESVDSVLFCLSKGLGAPVGSMLAGSADFVERARRNRKLLGGGMRQAGIIAAPGIEALSNVDRLETDHANAKTLAAGLDEVDGVTAAEPDTNIVVAETDVPAEEFIDAVDEEGIRASAFGDYRVRFCTHWDVDEDDVEEAVAGVRRAVA